MDILTALATSAGITAASIYCRNRYKQEIKKTGSPKNFYQSKVRAASVNPKSLAALTLWNITLIIALPVLLTERLLQHR